MPKVEKLVEAATETIADLLDDYFTRQVINAVPGYKICLLSSSAANGAKVGSSRQGKTVVRLFLTSHKLYAYFHVAELRTSSDGDWSSLNERINATVGGG